MAPLNIPHHWKKIEEILETVLQEDVEENEDDSDSEDLSNSDDTTSSLDVSDIEEVIAFVLHEQYPESVADSVESPYYPLSEDEDGNTTPVLRDVPDARRRLFDSSSSEEDDDGVSYLSD